MSFTVLRCSAIVAALLATVSSTLRIYPHQLAYFNEAAGGPQNGFRHLLGSNFDWGQDVLLANQICEEYQCSGYLIKGEVGISASSRNTFGDRRSLVVVSREAYVLPPDGVKGRQWHSSGTIAGVLNLASFPEFQVITPTLNLCNLPEDEQ